MTLLALQGGTPAVPVDLPKFQHPIDLKRFEFDSLREIDVLDYNGGGLIDQLEAQWAGYIGSKYGLATNSGTSAILSMMYGIGLKAGDEVIVPGYTFFATATPLVLLGCVPIPVDCLEDGNIDPDAIRREVTTRTKALIVTHMWGKPCALSEILSICSQYGLHLLEDASHAHGSTYANRRIGSFGIAAAWSFGARKLITGGQGGLMVTSDRRVYERAILLGHYNRRGQRDVTLPDLLPYAISGTGLNLRMHPYSAALIIQQLAGLDTMLAERCETANYLHERLSDINGLVLPDKKDSVNSSHYCFPLTYCESTMGISRKHFIEAVLAEGAHEVDAPGSTKPLLDFKIFQDQLSHRSMIPSLSRAMTYYSRLIKLPTWYGKNRMRYAKCYADAFIKVAEASLDKRLTHHWFQTQTHASLSSIDNSLQPISNISGLSPVARQLLHQLTLDHADPELIERLRQELSMQVYQ